jgi:hypothetical protein
MLLATDFTVAGEGISIKYRDNCFIYIIFSFDMCRMLFNYSFTQSGLTKPAFESNKHPNGLVYIAFFSLHKSIPLYATSNSSETIMHRMIYSIFSIFFSHYSLSNSKLLNIRSVLLFLSISMMPLSIFSSEDDEITGKSSIVLIL